MSTASTCDNAPELASDGSTLLRFHERDPAELAREAELADPWPRQLAIVQDFYRQVFELVGDEAWPDDPKGPFGDEWRGVGGVQSTHYLINVAMVIRELMQNASPGVGRTLIERVRTMLRPKNEDAYEEALVALEVGGMVASGVTPVLLEPLVPADWRPSQGQKPSSPDYGVRVPESMFTVEVTVWHWEAYAAWARMRQHLCGSLGSNDEARHRTEHPHRASHRITPGRCRGPVEPRFL